MPSLVSRTSFINVDLDVYSKRPLRRLADAMEQVDAFTLYCGRLAPDQYRASFELCHSPRTANSAIRGLAKLIPKLPPSARKLWDDATRRDFSVGIRAGLKPFSFESAVKPSTVALVASLDAQISYVIYAPDED